MCGIAGIVALDGFDPQTLVDMTHVISYRGPNGFGFAYTELGQGQRVEIIHNENRHPRLSRPVVGLGNRRLAILDTSSLGSMPMEVDDGALCLTFNGEIYNYKEIRKELEALGHRFKTGTDTEVILHAYKEWGEECLRRFNGMWSFALWDRSKQRIFCARDRFGVKPFFYSFSDRRFFLGSEIKQVLQASALPRRANASAVFDFMQLGLIDHSSATFFEDVHQLPGGHYLTLDLSDSLVPVVRRYWELRIEPQTNLSEEDATEEFLARFQNAVKLRLRSDVPIGICLSGGLDSSAILCQAKQLAPEIQFQTFSACFEEKAIDERAFMSIAIAATGCVGHPTYPKGPAFWENIHTMAFHHDEPLGSGSTFSQWSIMADARNHGIPVVLCGQGADEILCGYQKYRYFHLWHLLRHRDPRFVREIMLWTRNGTKSSGKWADILRYMPAMFRQPFSPVERFCTAEFRNDFRKVGSRLGAANSIADRQKTDLTYSSIPGMLRHEERNAMAHSVESRLPFLDYQLVEFAVNCPSSFKLRDGWSKWLLRNAMKGILPEPIRLRKTKLGFDAPEDKWMRLGLQNGHRGLWQSPKLRMERFLDGPNLARECLKFFRGSTSALPASSIFRAVSLELWAQVHGVS
jgi:asparagine synthase (glutamine-hydrolysing)